MAVPRITLESVGVRGFLPSSVPSLDAVFKRFYEDFVVRERSPQLSHLEKAVWHTNYSTAKPFVHFTLAKKNRTTPEALDMIARCGKFPAKRLSFHGMKDRKGVTFQRISLERDLWPAQDVRLHPHWDGCVDLGSFSEHTGYCRLGGLAGNRFSIALRDVNLSPDEAEKDLQLRLDSIRSGVPNYFGMQRFGTGTESSGNIGKALLQGDYKAACRLLSRSMMVDDESVGAAKAYDDGNLSEALRLTSVKRRVEHRLFKHLRDFSGDYEGAIQAIPKAQRLLYARAYGSKIWNEVLHRRIQEHGMSVLPDDFKFATKMRQNSSLHRSIAPQVQLPTVERGCDDIGQVVLPLPGCQADYGHLRDIYAEVVTQDGWDSLDSLTEKALHPEFKLEGGYRELVCEVKDLQGEIIPYHGNDLILETEITKQTEKADKSLPPSMAYVLHFDLPRGTYASIVVREFLRRDV